VSAGNLTVAIAWSSNTTAAISNTGVVVRQPGTADKIVTLTATLSNGGITQTKTFSITVTKLLMIAAVPTQSNTLTYSGASQSPTWNNTTNMTATGGTASSVNAGSFTRAFTPNTGYQWWDGTAAVKNASWSIAQKATSSSDWSISPTSIRVRLSNKTATVVVTKGSLTGNIIASTETRDAVVTDITSNSVKFELNTYPVNDYNYGLKDKGYISIGAGGNYKATSNKTVNIDVN